MPASWLSKGAVSPSIPGMVGLGWRPGRGGCEAASRWPQCALVQTWGGLHGPEGTSNRVSPEITPTALGQPPALPGGLFFPPRSDSGRRRRGGVPPTLLPTRSGTAAATPHGYRARCASMASVRVGIIDFGLSR